MAVGDAVILNFNNSGTLEDYQPAATVSVLFTCFGQYNYGYVAYYNQWALNNSNGVMGSTTKVNNMKFTCNNTIYLRVYGDYPVSICGVQVE